MPRYKFEIKVKDEYTAFDYSTEVAITTRHKTIVAKTLVDAREKLAVYMRQFNAHDYTARLIKSSIKEDSLRTFPLGVHIGA